MSGAATMGKLFTLSLNIWILGSTAQVFILELKYFFFPPAAQRVVPELIEAAGPRVILIWGELPFTRLLPSPEPVHPQKRKPKCLAGPFGPWNWRVSYQGY